MRSDSSVAEDSSLLDVTPQSTGKRVTNILKEHIAFIFNMK